ncbi:MAG: phosphotransferase family protein [Hyphomicrobiales bacterium]|nr:phosphotransferase family protein [Hyphomicrobiales bacterium]
MAPATPLPFAPEDLDKLLTQSVAGFRGLESVVKFATGQSNPTFLVKARSGRYVLRMKPLGALLKSAHAVDREFRVLRALKGSRVPVPEALWLCEDPGPLGAAFYVMNYVEGRIFWDPALPDLDVAQRAAIYDAMNEGLAALHDLDPEALDLGDYGKPGSYFARQTSRWSDQYRQSETGDVPEMNDLMAWLATHQPDDDGRVALVHGDWRIDNMIFDAAAPKIRAVLDWELSTLGHPFADLAYQCMQWRLPHEGNFRGLAGVDRQALGIPSEEAYVDAYCRRRGLSGISAWPFCLAFSFFRLAAILQGVKKRALMGNASNPERGLQMGSSVPLLARMGLEASTEAQR